MSRKLGVTNKTYVPVDWRVSSRRRTDVSGAAGRGQCKNRLYIRTSVNQKRGIDKQQLMMRINDMIAHNKARNFVKA
jgi:hypothetical protein